MGTFGKSGRSEPLPPVRYDQLRFSTLLAHAVLWQHRYNARCTRYRGPYELAQITQSNYKYMLSAALRNAALLKISLVRYVQQKPGVYARKIRVAFYWQASQQISRLLATQSHLQNGLPDGRLALADLIETLRALEHQTLNGRSGHIKRDLGERWPAYWREQVLLTLPRIWYLPFLVAACSGCRPIELLHGVRVRTRLVDGLPYIQFRIEGAKVTAIAGQPYRELTIRGDRGALTQRLFDAVAGDDGATEDRGMVRERVISIRTIQQWQRALGEVARQIPSYRGLCPMVLRHRFAADLKLAGTPRIERSRALGHVSNYTLNYYGRIGIRHAAASPLALVDVQVPRELHFDRGNERLNALPKKPKQQYLTEREPAIEYDPAPGREPNIG